MATVPIAFLSCPPKRMVSTLIRRPARLSPPFPTTLPAVKLSIVVPVYNERKTVLQVLERVRDLEFDVDKEIVVVDDGSSDGTAELLREQPPTDDVVLELRPANGGKGAALRDGIAAARGDYIVIQDADLELDPADIAKLLEPVLAGTATVVYGSRFVGRPHMWKNVNYWANRTLTMISNILFGARLTDMETCYKLFPAPLLKSMRLESRRFEIEPELTAKALRLGHRIVEVPIQYFPRTVLEGKKLRWQDGFTALSMLIGQRLAPLSSLTRPPEDDAKP